MGKMSQLKVKSVLLYLGNDPEDPMETSVVIKFQANRVREMIVEGTLALENIKTVHDFDAWLETILGKEEFDNWLEVFALSGKSYEQTQQA